jgi:hypothetical protein
MSTVVFVTPCAHAAPAEAKQTIVQVIAVIARTDSIVPLLEKNAGRLTTALVLLPPPIIVGTQNNDDANMQSAADSRANAGPKEEV